jgi:hypothetical protein
MVRDFNNTQYQVNCHGYEHTVKYIKFVLNMKTKIDIKNIQLYMNGINLLDHKTFAEYKINEHSKIRMCFTLRTG